MAAQPNPGPKFVISSEPLSPGEIPDAEVELAFRFDPLLALNPRLKISDASMADYLAHSVAASPGNLFRHTQRILHFFANRNRDGLFSALLDLFIALDGKGAELRKRLLNFSRNRLLPEELAFLSHWLEQGRPPGQEAFAKASQSVLSPGCAGIRELVKVSHAETASPRDPLVEAREFIEYSQVEQARELLETAVLAQPGREELHRELAQLYRATRDAAHFQSMREKLGQILIQLPDCWLQHDETRPSKGDASR